MNHKTYTFLAITLLILGVSPSLLAKPAKTSTKLFGIISSAHNTGSKQCLSGAYEGSPHKDASPKSIWKSSERSWKASSTSTHDVWLMTSSNKSSRRVFRGYITHKKLPLSIDVTSRHFIKLTNKSDQNIPRVFLVKSRGERSGNLFDLGPAGAGKSVLHGGNSIASPSPKEGPRARHVENAKKILKPVLKKSGLANKALDAAMNQLIEEHIKPPGYRILYVMPQSWVSTHFANATQNKKTLILGSVDLINENHIKYLVSSFSAFQKGTSKDEPHVSGKFKIAQILAARKATKDKELKRFISQYLKRKYPAVFP